MRGALQNNLVLLLTILVIVLNVGSQGGKASVSVAEMISQVLELHLSRCHLVLITTQQSSILLDKISMKRSFEGVVVVDAGSASTGEHFLRGLWGDARTTCRALVLHITSENNATNMALRLLESSGMWRLPETYVFVVGGREGVEAVLLHHSLRNTLHALYLSTNYFSTTTTRLRKAVVEQGVSDTGQIYRRCLYCNNGKADVLLIPPWNITSSVLLQSEVLFPEKLQNLMGHQFRIVSVQYFPYVDYVKEKDQPGSRVTLLDSLDARLLAIISQALNFTYEIREEPNRSWGRENDGSFTGMTGQLQREEADFCTMASQTPERLRVIQHAKAYDADMLTLTSPKPSILPEHLSLIRPFAGELWLALMVSVVAWGIIQWLMQRVWRWAAGGPGLRLSTSLLYGWGALLEHPPPDPSVSTSGRVLVGWWLLFSLIITTGFRSSLIAHLTVQGKSQPIDTLEDLVGRANWKWGIETWMLKGVPYDYLSKHTHSVVKKFYKEMEVLDVEEGMPKVVDGRYTFVSVKNHISVIVASLYTDSQGQTPIYISSRGIYTLPDYGWGFRRGAPFYSRFRDLMSRLGDSGIMSYWNKDVIARRVRKNREAAALNAQVVTRLVSREVALGLHHLQGAFYLLLLGCIVAFLTLLTEHLALFFSTF